jgi:hypothetical protein
VLDLPSWDGIAVSYDGLVGVPTCSDCAYGISVAVIVSSRTSRRNQCDPPRLWIIAIPSILSLRVTLTDWIQ